MKNYIKFGFAIILVLLIIVELSNRFSENTSEDDINSNSELFKDSYKKQKTEQKLEFTEFLDSITNVYSNFKYSVSFDAPNNWKTDAGVNEQTIFRAYEADSGISFSITIIELNLNSIEKKKRVDIWEEYQRDNIKTDIEYKNLLKQQFNSEINNFTTEKAFIKNQISKKTTFNLIRRELDFEYESTCVMYQTQFYGIVYTFTLNIPTIFFELNSPYYENLFSKISFLKNDEIIN